MKIAQGVLTAEHVILDANTIEVMTSDGRHASATVVRSDSTCDLALLSADLNLPPLPIAPARSDRQGDPLLVLGYLSPDILNGSDTQATLTRGVLSAIRTTGEFLQ